MRLLYSWEEDKLATIFLSFTTKNLSPNSAGTFKPTIWAATKNFQKSDIFQWRGKNYRVTGKRLYWSDQSRNNKTSPRSVNIKSGF